MAEGEIFVPKLTHVLRPTDKNDIVDLDERLSFCRASLEALEALAGRRGWFASRRPQALMKEVGEYFVVGLIEFAENAELTWVTAEFKPIALDPLAWEILFEKKLAWDIKFRAEKLTLIEVPSFKGDGWSDTDMSPEENATRILSSMDRLTDELPTGVSYSEFLQASKDPSLYRVAEAVSLILEEKHELARVLAEEMLSGEKKATGFRRVQSPDGSSLTVERLILKWLEEQRKVRDK